MLLIGLSIARFLNQHATSCSLRLVTSPRPLAVRTESDELPGVLDQGLPVVTVSIDQFARLLSRDACLHYEIVNFIVERCGGAYAVAFVGLCVVVGQ